MITSINNELEKYKRTKNQPIVIFGTSGISKEVYSVINEINMHYGRSVYNFLGYVAESNEYLGETLTGGKAVCTDESFSKFAGDYEALAAVIPLGTPSIKHKIRERIKSCSNVFYPNIISPSAQIMIKDGVCIGVGNIICSGVVATTDIKIGDFNLFNLNTTIGHDVNIGNYNVVNPLCAISGFVTIGDQVLIGAGVSIKEHLTINSNSTVGMGAIVCKDVESGTIVVSERAKLLVK